MKYLTTVFLIFISMGSSVCAKNPLTQTPVNALGGPYPEFLKSGFCLYPTVNRTVFSAVFPYKFMSFGFSSELNYNRKSWNLKSAKLFPIINANILNPDGNGVGIRIGYQRDFLLSKIEQPFFAFASAQLDLLFFEVGIQLGSDTLPSLFWSSKIGYLTLQYGNSKSKKEIHLIIDLPIFERFFVTRFVCTNLQDFFTKGSSEYQARILIVGTFKR